MVELILNKPRNLTLRSMEIQPPLNYDDVKVRLIYGGICGSDLGVFQGKIKYASYPIRPGHELLGTVVDAGENVKSMIGVRVVVFPNSFCGECEQCKKGKTNICIQKKSLGVNTDGGFSQEFIISSKYVIPVPDDMPDQKAVLVEPFSVIVHAFNRVVITEETSVAVIGCGSEGMLAVAFANYLGAQVTAIDINSVKLDLVKKLGSVRTMLPQELTNEVFDVVIEASGSGSAMEQGIKLVKSGGSMVLVGLVPEAVLPIVYIVRQEISLLGSIIYDVNDFLHAIEFLKDDLFDVHPIVSRIMPISAYQQAYDLALSGDVGKILLDFREVVQTIN